MIFSDITGGLEINIVYLLIVGCLYMGKQFNMIICIAFII